LRPPEPPPKEAPPRIKVVERSADHFRVRWRWFQPRVFIGAGMSVFWGALCWVLEVGFGRDPGFAALLPCVAFEVVLAYWTLAGLFNSTEVSVTRGALSVHHGPVPWWGTRRYAPGALKSVEVRARRGADPRIVSEIRYELWARDNGDVVQRIVGGLASPDAVDWLQEEIEQRLG
jgi:hypothetical protein